MGPTLLLLAVGVVLWWVTYLFDRPEGGHFADIERLEERDRD